MLRRSLKCVAVMACLGIMAMLMVGCAGTQTDPYGGISAAVTGETAAAQSATVAVQGGILPMNEGAKIYSALSLTEVGLQATVPLATASGRPTPTTAQPNPVTLETLQTQFQTLTAALIDLHKAVTASAGKIVGEARAGSVHK